MGFTRESARAAAERRHANKTDSPSSAMAEAPAPDAANEELMRLATALADAASKKADQAKALADVEAFLGRLKPGDYPDLAASPVVQAFVEQLAERKAADRPDDPPGTIYNRGTLAESKKDWQVGDLVPEKGWPWVYDYEPSVSEVVIWNGVHAVFTEGVPWSGPKLFVDQLNESRRATRLAREHAEYLMRMRNTISDPSLHDSGTARVRGVGKGSYLPGAGVFDAGDLGVPEEAIAQ
jgi:hypothetical protein